MDHIRLTLHVPPAIGKLNAQRLALSGLMRAQQVPFPQSGFELRILIGHLMQCDGMTMEIEMAAVAGIKLAYADNY